MEYTEMIPEQYRKAFHHLHTFTGRNLFLWCNLANQIEGLSPCTLHKLSDSKIIQYYSLGFH